jgi:phage baseplate assembly protein W
MAQGHDFLGRGWRFPVLPDARGGLGYSEGSENIEHSLQVLLLTHTRERVMRPGFGTAAPGLVFAPGSHRYLRLLEGSLRDAVVEFEPRVDLLGVLAEVDPRDATRVTVSVRYRERRTNAIGNLVFPFYLDKAGRPQ